MSSKNKISKHKKQTKLPKYNQNYCSDIKIGPWSTEEDEMIVRLVRRYGPQKWSNIARHLPGRIGKQCRERWHNHLNPNIRKDSWTVEEEWLLFLYHLQIGNRWAEIARVLKGRTDNSIKNHWNSAMKKNMPEYQLRYATYISEHYEYPHTCSLPMQEETLKKRGRKTATNTTQHPIACYKLHSKLIEQAAHLYEELGDVESGKENQEVIEKKSPFFELTPRSSLNEYSVLDDTNYDMLSPFMWKSSAFMTPIETPHTDYKRPTPECKVFSDSLEKSTRSGMIFESPSLMLNLEDTPKTVRPFSIHVNK